MVSGHGFSSPEHDVEEFAPLNGAPVHLHPVAGLQLRHRHDAHDHERHDDECSAGHSCVPDDVQAAIVQV